MCDVCPQDYNTKAGLISRELDVTGPHKLKQAVRLGGRHNMPRPVTLTFDLLTLKSAWESHVTWGTPVQSFVFLV